MRHPTFFIVFSLLQPSLWGKDTSHASFTPTDGFKHFSFEFFSHPSLHAFVILFMQVGGFLLLRSVTALPTSGLTGTLKHFPIYWDHHPLVNQTTGDVAPVVLTRAHLDPSETKAY